MRKSIALAALATLAACSGGGSSTPSAIPTPTYVGAGAHVAFNQVVNFSITVPPAAPPVPTSRRRATPASRAHVGDLTTPAPTSPYVSPATGSIVLTLAFVDGVSPQVAAPTIAPINIPANCLNSAAGCQFSASGILAATGTDRYLVQTFTAANGGGTLISTGFVDVVVGSASATDVPAGTGKLGNAALSIGGFVNSVVLSPAALNFTAGKAGDATIGVAAVDAAGATIIGAVQFATPITVAVTDAQNFTLNGQATVSVPGPLSTPINLHYGGGLSFGTSVTATSANSAQAAVSAKPLAVNVKVITPPSPTPPPIAPLSLYVADTATDTVSEYRNLVTTLVSGQAPNPAATPDRVFQFLPANVPTSLVGAAGISCSSIFYGPGTGNGIAGLAVDSNANVYIEPSCADANNAAYLFGFPPSAVGTAAIPTIADTFPGLFSNFGSGLAIMNGTLFAEGPAPSAGSEAAVYSFPVGKSSANLTTLGGQCFEELGYGNSGANCYNALYGNTFGVDTLGHTYLGAYYNDPPLSGDAANYILPSAILVFSAAQTGTTVAPNSVLSGVTASGMSSSGAGPLGIAVDGTTLLVVSGAQTVQNSATGAVIDPGLSNCPPTPAGGNATLNAPVTATSSGTQCADGQLHEYLLGFTLTSALLGPAANGLNVDFAPAFALGGDTIGRFGCSISGGVGGQFIATYGGYTFILNQSPTCPTGQNLFAPEIDVYKTSGVSGAYTNAAPIFHIPLNPNGLPFAIAIGPPGTAVGGQSLLHRAAPRAYRPGLFGPARANTMRVHRLGRN